MYEVLKHPRRPLAGHAVMLLGFLWGVALLWCVVTWLCGWEKPHALDEIKSSGNRGILLALWGASAGALITRGRQMLATSADLALKADTRSPVLLLRSFADDELAVERPDYFSFSFERRYQKRLTLEEVLSSSLGHIGPVVAIGRPGEPLAPFGAARRYVSHETWKSAVEEWLQQASVVVMVMGEVAGNKGLSWELDRVRDLGHLRKLILVMPPGTIQQATQRWDQYRNYFCSELPPYDRSAIAITFNAAGQPRVERIQVASLQKRKPCAEHHTQSLPVLLRDLGHRMSCKTSASTHNTPPKKSEDERSLCYLCGKLLKPNELPTRVCDACRV